MVEIFRRHSILLGDCLRTLMGSSVMVAGVGGLGSTVSELLTRTGVGHLVLVDPKVIDVPDLNRQILYDRTDLGRKKVEVAGEKLLSINPHLRIDAVDETIDENFHIPDVDLVVDCLDNFRSRFVLEDKAWRMGIPLVHGGVKGYSGQVTVVQRGRTKRLREIFGDVEDEGGPFQVFPPTVVTIGSVQAAEVVKILCGDEDGSLLNRLLVVDLGIGSFETIYLG